MACSEHDGLTFWRGPTLKQGRKSDSSQEHWLLASAAASQQARACRACATTSPLPCHTTLRRRRHCRKRATEKRRVSHALLLPEARVCERR